MDYKARYYSPRLGRFTQPDTIIPGMSSQNFNRYSYVNNNPIMMTDPSGHRPAGDCEADAGESCGGLAECGPWNNNCIKGKGAGGNGGTKGGSNYNHANTPAEEDVTGEDGTRDARFRWWYDADKLNYIAFKSQEAATTLSGTGAGVTVVLTAGTCSVALCPVGLMAGEAFHAGITNPLETVAGGISLIATARVDVLTGATYWNTDGVIDYPVIGDATINSIITVGLGTISQEALTDYAIDYYSSQYNRGNVDGIIPIIKKIFDGMTDGIVLGN